MTYSFMLPETVKKSCHLCILTQGFTRLSRKNSLRHCIAAFVGGHAPAVLPCCRLATSLASGRVVFAILWMLHLGESNLVSLLEVWRKQNLFFSHLVFSSTSFHFLSFNKKPTWGMAPSLPEMINTSQIPSSFLSSFPLHRCSSSLHAYHSP